MSNRYPIDFYYPSFGLESYVEKVNRDHQFDAVIVNYPWMTKLLTTTSIKHKLYFTHDKFTDKSQTIHAECYSLTSKQEKKVLDRADTVLSIQGAETEYFRHLVPGKDILTVYTPFDYTPTEYVDNHNVLFFSGNSELNRNGIMHFVEKVWPDVVSRNPKSKLLIGGGICKALMGLEKDSSIQLLGYIDNVTDFYSKGNITINPVYQGTGLKIKTLESLSYGKITIVHPHSAEGLYLQENAPVLIAHTDEDYANMILSHQGDATSFVANQLKAKLYLSDMNHYIKSQYQSIEF